MRTPLDPCTCHHFDKTGSRIHLRLRTRPRSFREPRDSVFSSDRIDWRAGRGRICNLGVSKLYEMFPYVVKSYCDLFAHFLGFFALSFMSKHCVDIALLKESRVFIS